MRRQMNEATRALVVTIFCISIGLLTIALAAPAQEGKDPTTKSPQVQMRLILTDGCVLSGAPLSTHVEIRTKHGPISVPWTDLRTLSLGPRLMPKEEAVVKNALEQLGSGVGADRERASDTLITIGAPAYPFVFAMQNSTDLEVAARCRTIVKLMQDRYGKAMLREPSADEFNTSALNGSGEVTSRAIKLQTSSIGVVEVDLARLRSVTVSTLFLSEGMALTVPAKSPIEWIDSGILLSHSDRTISVSAIGTVDLYPSAPGQYLVINARAQGNDVRTYVVEINVPNGRTSVPCGALLYRFGESGPVQILGTGGRMSGVGKLYFAIAPGPWGSTNGAPAISGEYKVHLHQD